jgi:hypothetical protein
MSGFLPQDENRAGKSRRPVAGCAHTGPPPQGKATPD